MVLSKCGVLSEIIGQRRQDKRGSSHNVAKMPAAASTVEVAGVGATNQLCA